MKPRTLALAVLAALPLLPGCLQGRGPAGEAGNLAVRANSPLSALVQAGKLYLEQDEANDAYVVLKRAVALDPKSYEAQLGLAQACGELGELTAGLAAAEAAAGLQPQAAEPLYAAGRICAASWKLEPAEEHFGRAVKLDPKHGEAWRDLGRVRLRRAAIEGGSVKPAIEALERARALSGKDAEGVALLAEAYARGERYADAITEYTRAVALDPANADYPRNLAWLLMMEGQALDKARELALKSDELQRGDGDALVAAAVALLRQGELDQAIEELQAAVKAVGSNADAYAFLAQAAAERGRPADYDMAINALKYMRGMELTPRHISPDELDRLVQAIGAGVRRLQTGE
jgi:tetratricopeptide (TPR) repeat protein